MSATTIAALSALLGLSLKAFETYEEIRQRAIAAGEITAEDFADQDRLLAEQVQRLKDLTSGA